MHGHLHRDFDYRREGRLAGDSPFLAYDVDQARTSTGRLDSVRKLRPWFEIGRDLPVLTSMRLLVLSDLHLEWATLRWPVRSTGRRSRSRTTGPVASESQRDSPRGYRDRHGFENESSDPPLVADVAESAAYRTGRA